MIRKKFTTEFPSTRGVHYHERKLRALPGGLSESSYFHGRHGGHGEKLNLTHIIIDIW
jgi:hypothetical protein